MTAQQRWTLAATGLGLFMIFLDVLIVNVGLPAIQASFAVGEAGLQWVVAAYSLGMAVFIMSAATLADLHGRRRLYVIGIAVFTVASVACGLAPSIEFLNVARGIQGAAAATANVTSLALVSAAFPDPRQKARAIGIWAAIAGCVERDGPHARRLPGRAPSDGAASSWSTCRSASSSFPALRYVRSRATSGRARSTLPGRCCSWSRSARSRIAVIEGPQGGMDVAAASSRCFAIAASAGIAFVRFERRTPDPMMDVSLFRDPAYALAIVTICAVFFTIYGMLLLTTQYLQNVRGFTPEQTGLFLLPFSVAMTIVSPIAGGMVGRYGARTPIRVGLADHDGRRSSC